MIASDKAEPEGEDDLSDEEEDMDATDGKEAKEEPASHDCKDHSFLTSVMENFLDKVSFLKTREGRAGLVHNFLRGLQLMAAPVPSGKTLESLRYPVFGVRFRKNYQ